MNEADAAFASFIAKLEQAYPEWRLLQLYLPRGNPAELAAEAVAHEFSQAVFHLPDLTVAVSKLQWWGEELTRWQAGEARHPLTRRLATVRDVAPAATLPLLLDAAARVHEALPAADFGQQLTQLQPAFAAIEQVRAALLGLAPASPAAVQVDALRHLLRQLARLPLAEGEASPALSMQLLARHQLRREDLAQAGPKREAAVADQLGHIAAALQPLQGQLRGDSWIRRVRWHCEMWRARPLGPGADLFPPLWRRLDRTPWNLGWQAWRERRRDG